MDFLNLIRWKNLVFLAFTLWLMYVAVVETVLGSYGFEGLLSPVEQVLMIASVMFIAAGGYVINDYFDVKIDAINKPESRVVGRVMDRQRAIVIHQILTGVGVVCGVVLAVLVRNVTLGGVYVLVPGLLWFYSASYKRQFFVGNLIVACNVGFAIFMVALVAVAKLEVMYHELLFQTPLVRTLYLCLGAFAVFAFLCTLIREIVKDMEDEEGDREMECHTLPIRLGVVWAKVVVLSLIACVAALLVWINWWVLPFEGTLSIRYMSWGLFLPLGILAVLVVVAGDRRAYGVASQMAKFVMLVGVLYSVVFGYLVSGL